MKKQSSPYWAISTTSILRIASGQKTLMFTGLMDNIGPPSSQFAAYNKITAKQDVVIYPDFGHEYLPFGMDKTMRFMLEML